MNKLPVIVGFGGFNAAGRSSFHHAYRRTVLESISDEKRNQTLVGLACMMKLVTYAHDKAGISFYQSQDEKLLTSQEVVIRYKKYIEDNTLIRKIHFRLFDADHVAANTVVKLHADNSNIFTVSRRDLPNPVPENWQVNTIDDKKIQVTITGDLEVEMKSYRQLEVRSAGMLPTGFEPGEHYHSRFHPKGLKMAVMAASDALNSIGIEWNTILEHVHPDQIAVFAASGLGQTDEHGIGGYLQARLKSSRASSKQMALGLNSMPADFVNAYVCGSVGTTGAVAGACATFLYNLRLAVEDIKSGKTRVAICGCSEAPVTPEVLEAYAAMSALATDDKLAKLDGLSEADHRRASRPFAQNCGFTMGESAQYFVLMDDELAVQLGAQIHGAIPDVFINADGYKKSISSPGAGNYITLAKAVASAQAILGEEAIKQRSFIHSHGSSTPQNRITESMVFDKVAQAFDIKDWKISAVKAFVGHPLGPASGDQLANSLGVFAEGVIPGIKTATKIADDVIDERLDILLHDTKAPTDVAFLNSKGFGGNNATATVIAPNVVEKMLANRYSRAIMHHYETARNKVREAAQQYDNLASQGDFQVIYHFGEGMIEDESIRINSDSISIESFPQHIDLQFDNPFEDMV